MDVQQVELIRTPAGQLHLGEAFYFRRRASSGWLQARTAHPGGLWVTGTDKNGLVKTVRTEHITRIDRKRIIWRSPDSYKAPNRRGR